ncbi:hypothetical protein [Amycolatopsis sp. lyj-112]|uniref:hypothetical protein n=1 Tax=Amycolatopsis sp. lyj-112 TaxID=2789288 RepID=UPI00397E6D5C
MDTSYEEDLEYLLNYAQEDWVGLSVVGGIAGTRAGKGATFDEMTSALLAVISDLIDRGAVPGDLVEGDPGFVPWLGTKDEVLARFANEVRALRSMPETGEVCWIHDPTA